MKNKFRCLLWVKRLCWAILLLDLILIFLVPTEIDADNMTLMIAYAVWLILTVFLATTWLMIFYRDFFQSWIGWIMPIIILIFSSLVSSGLFQIHNPRLSLFYILLTIASMWGVGVATIIFLWYQDYGLKLVSSALVIITWLGFFASYFQGNLFELLVANLNQLETPSPLWWLNPLFCVFWWIIPIGISSFIVHTFRIIANEMSQTQS